MVTVRVCLTGFLTFFLVAASAPSAVPKIMTPTSALPIRRTPGFFSSMLEPPREFVSRLTIRRPSGDSCFCPDLPALRRRLPAAAGRVARGGGRHQPGRPEHERRLLVVR